MALIHMDFYSKALMHDVGVDVILPQQSGKLIGMDTSAGGESFRTLYLLHGMSDNHTIWDRRTSIERYAAPYGLAVVMPNAHLSSYADMAHGGKYFTYIAHELPEKMRAWFPLSDKREDNYVAGLSMGGAGAMKIGIACPETFSAIGCLSAGMYNHRIEDKEIWKSPNFIRLYGGRDIEGTEEDIIGGARKIIENGLPVPRIYHTCGAQDFLLDCAHETREFFLSFPGNPFSYTYEEDPGVHSWEYWDEHIQRFLSFACGHCK